MERAVTTAGFNDKTMGEIIKTLAEKAGMNAEIKGADDRKKFILQRDMTDIQFIRNYAEEKNAAFIVKNGKFVFKPLKEMPGGTDVILEYEKTLIEFEAFRESRNICGSVETRGFDYSNFKSISKTLQSDTMSLKIGGEAVAPKTADSAYGKKVMVLNDLSIPDEKAAETRCDSALGEMSGKYIYISGKCQGNILMHAGNNVNIKEAGESYSGIYFLTSVTHRLVPMKGYTVNFEGFRNALPSPPKVPPKDAKPQEDKKKEEGKLNPEFTNLAWKLEDKAVEKAHVGDKLKLTADCSQMGAMKSVFIPGCRNDPDKRNASLANCSTHFCAILAQSLVTIIVMAQSLHKCISSVYASCVNLNPFFLRSRFDAASMPLRCRFDAASINLYSRKPARGSIKIK